MKQHILIVGAGLIGTALAHRLTESGARVTLLDRAGPGAGASGASFGWINASFYADADHHRLRAAGIAAHRKLNLPLTGVQWRSCIWFEAQGAELDRMAADLRDLHYPIERLDQKAFSAMVPDVSPPVEALHFTAEGVVDPAEMNRVLFDAALARGAQAILGVGAKGILRKDGRVCGVLTDQGDLLADQVVIAAGTGAQALIGLPMLCRPGLLMKTNALPRFLNHVLVSPLGEIKQDEQGRLVMPTAIGHQGDSTEEISTTPDVIADVALTRLRSLFPRHDLRWSEVALAYRPVPQDGLPVIGAVEKGLYATVMHSGVTLAAITAEYAVQELLEGRLVNALGPYRPQRFDL